MRFTGPVAVLLLVAGCAGAPVDDPLATDGGPAQDVEFFVPGLRVGDTFQYAVGFSGQGFSFTGTSQVEVVQRTTIPDAAGTMRDALLVRQGQQGGGFSEDFWVDAKTLVQFKMVRADTYNETTRFPAEPASAVPQRHAIYANATGVLERFLDDPLFEDFNFFGGALVGVHLPDAGPINITGNMWQRNDTEFLMGGLLEGVVSTPPAADPTWGELREVAFVADFADEEDYEKVQWTGKMSRTVPLAVDMLRQIDAKFDTEEFHVKFNATLLAYSPGDGEEFVRDEWPGFAGPRQIQRDGSMRAPADGGGPKLLFPLSEGIGALANDPTAIQYFQAHADAYLAFGHMFEVNTCGAYPSPTAGCHWLDWFGAFYGPGDDSILYWRAEKYADGSGTGAVYVPVVYRDYPFDVVFDAIDGEYPSEPPPQSVWIEKAAFDVPPRSAYAEQVIPIGGAVQVWKDAASAGTKDLTPTFMVLFIEPDGYGYFIDHYDWVFPTNPELFPLYDDAPLELSRHPMMMLPDGRIVHNTNYDVKVEQT